MKTLRPASQSWPALRRAATLNPQFHAFQPPASSRAALLPLWVALITAFAFSVHGASLIRFESTSLTVDENAAEVVLNVWRTGDVTTTVTADFLTVDSSAKAGEDYAATSGSLSFEPGLTNLTIRIPILNDALNEPASESFQVRLANPSAGTTLGLAASVSITDNDGIKIEFTAYRAGENTATVTLALVRGPDEIDPASVDYLTAAGTAVAGTDFTAASGVAQFQAGARVALVNVSMLNDGLNEPDETFRVSFSNAVGGKLVGPASATVTILDNDKGVEFVQNRLWVHEDQEGVRIEVTRGNDGLLDSFVVAYTVANISAVAGNDFMATNGSLSFAAGEMTRSIWVPVLNDGVAEPDETFRVTLSNPTAGLPLGRSTFLTATVTICDATGMEPRRFRSIQRLADGAFQLDLQGRVHTRFLPYYSIFQLEASADLRQWQPLKLVGYRNNATSPPVLTDVPAPESPARFFRLNATPFVTPSLPPTGPYPVGIVRRFLFDPLRRNRFGISTNNSFLVTVWYPANPSAGQSIAGYDPEQHANDIDWQFVAFMDRAPRFASYSILDAPLRPSADGYPVVLNSHCSGCDGLDQENLAENLASHGYVVATIDHADAPLSLLPDGSLLKQIVPASSVPGTLERVKDLGFLVDELGRLNQEDPLLTGAFRRSLLAAMGWSWGAETVAEFSRVDSRCLAAISFDGGTGTVTAETLRVGLQKPSLTMNRAENSTDLLYKFATRDAYFLQISGTIHGDFGTYGWQNNPDNIASSQEAQRTIHAYVLSFVNKHLKGEDDHLLDARSPLFPRVSMFRKK